MAQLTFWFEFASTYSYLSAMRIEEVAGKSPRRYRLEAVSVGPDF